MTFTDPNLTTVLVFCMAGLILIQTIGLVVALVRVTNKARLTEAAVVRITEVVGDRMKEAHQTLEQLAWIQERMPLIEERSNAFIDAAGTRLEQFDARVGETIQKATLRVEESGRKLEYGLAQFNRQTTQLIRDFHYPAGHVAAVLKGVSAGIKAWRKTSSGIPLQDEESFI
jgi:hypothetical protein